MSLGSSLATMSAGELAGRYGSLAGNTMEQADAVSVVLEGMG